MYYTHLVKPNLNKTVSTNFSQPVILMTPPNADVAPVTLNSISTRTQPLDNVYSPPLKKEGPGLPLILVSWSRIRIYQVAFNT